MRTSVRFGPHLVGFPSAELGSLAPTPAVTDDSLLVERLRQQGYLWLQRFHAPEVVLEARQELVDYLRARGAVCGEEAASTSFVRGAPPITIDELQPVAHAGAMANILAAPRLFAMFSSVFDTTATSYSFRWLRATPPGQATGPHIDRVYMGRGSRAVHTVWTPIGDVGPQEGSLALCLGAADRAEARRIARTYGKLDVDRDRVSDHGWFSEDPLELAERTGGKWCTAEFSAGDIVVFGLDLFHASTVNGTSRWRLSCDTRFQPAVDPIDDRWGGPSPTGHTHFGRTGKDAVTMRELRAGWEKERT